MENKIKILAISGSLRKDSFNTKLLHFAKDNYLENVEIEIADISLIPLYNQDLELTMPDSVIEFKKKIKESDAILLATPEYNYSFSGVLKNAIDWASRPSKESSWDGKPVAILSASTGMLGGSRAQYQLRQVLTALNMFTLNKPEIMVSSVKEKFDEKGNLTDEKTKEKIKELVSALVLWTKKLK